MTDEERSELAGLRQDVRDLAAALDHIRKAVTTLADLGEEVTTRTATELHDIKIRLAALEAGPN